MGHIEKFPNSPLGLIMATSAPFCH